MTGEIEDDAAIADKPPELPAAGEGGEGGAVGFRRAVFPRSGSRQTATPGFVSAFPPSADPAGSEQWAPGAEPIAAAPADPEIKLAALGGSADPGGAGERSPARTTPAG